MKLIRLIITVISWILGLFFLFPGISATFQGTYLAALACFLLAALFIPVSRAVIVTHIPLLKNLGVSAVAVVILFSLIGFDVSESRKSENPVISTPDNVAIQPTVKNSTPIETPSTEKPKDVVLPNKATPPRHVVDDAYLLCGALEATGVTADCEVKGWGSSVDVTIDTNGTEARKMCAGVVEMMKKHETQFDGNWKLRIFSPYSGERPIASCILL